MMDRETELRDQLAELRREHAAVTARIPELLATGGDTGPVRRDAAELGRRIADATAALEKAVDQREARAQDAIFAAASVIATATLDDITARLSALKPQHP
jgi:hypothetical protein